MNCSKCKKKNIKKALYCKYCGNKFTQREKEKAENEGLVALLKKIKKWYEACTLKVITDNIIFKLLVIGAGIYNFVKIGNSSKTQILDSEKYNIFYNSDKEEYYIVIDDNLKDEELSIPLNLYVPNKVNNLNLTYYNEKNEIIGEHKYDKKEDIVLSANISSDNYYILNDGNDKLKVFVYYEVNDNDIEK